MSSEMPDQHSKSKPGFLDTPAMHPVSKMRTVAYIPVSKVKHFQIYGPAYRYYEILHLVRETLGDPEACYPYRKSEFPGYCYTRAVEYRFTNRGVKIPRAPGFVFTVFVNAKLHLADFGWERHQEDDRLKPLLSEGRLEAALWYTTK